MDILTGLDRYIGEINKRVRSKTMEEGEMKKILAVIVAVAFLFSFGFVTQARAGSTGTTVGAAVGGATGVLIAGGSATQAAGSAIGAGTGAVAGLMVAGPVGAIGGAVLGGVFGVDMFGSKPKVTTATRYNQYLGDQNKISKLQTKLANTTDPSKVAKLNTQISKLTTKMNNINPVVSGLNAYQNDVKHNKPIPSALLTKINTSEGNQYNKLGTKITNLGNKLAAGGLNQKQETKIQNKINYLSGEQSWLQSRTNSILGH